MRNAVLATGGHQGRGFGVPLLWWVSLVCSTKDDGGGVRLNESELKPSKMDSLGWAPPQNVKEA